MPEVFFLSAITSGLPSNIYGQSSVQSGKKTPVLRITVFVIFLIHLSQTHWFNLFY